MGLRRRLRRLASEEPSDDTRPDIYKGNYERGKTEEEQTANDLLLAKIPGRDDGQLNG